MAGFPPWRGLSSAIVGRGRADNKWPNLRGWRIYPFYVAAPAAPTAAMSSHPQQAPRSTDRRSCSPVHQPPCPTPADRQRQCSMLGHFECHGQSAASAPQSRIRRGSGPEELQQYFEAYPGKRCLARDCRTSPAHNNVIRSPRNPTQKDRPALQLSRNAEIHFCDLRLGGSAPKPSGHGPPGNAPRRMHKCSSSDNSESCLCTVASPGTNHQPTSQSGSIEKCYVLREATSCVVAVSEAPTGRRMPE